MVIFLGSTALKSLVGPDRKITRLRGTWMEWERHLAMPVYHPSALLRNPALKRDTWEDFKKIVYKYRELIDPSHHSDHV
jgi:DNA polymerase